VRTRNVLVTFVVTAVAAGTGVAVAGWRVAGTTAADVQASNPRLDVTGGQVQGLYPGGTVQTDLNVGNPNTFPVDFGTVTFESVEVDPGHPNCPAGVLGLDFSNPHRLLMPQLGEVFQVGVAMSPSAPQDCVGASFHVVYRAEGTVGTVAS
jgi:hypothetical protein